ncbi:MAG TPA: hypothetical protein VK633_11820 [Verrucomicrobiae bacterium]|nr:hypothetical protein [Verrucomicrobiae bacterium]
MKPHQKAEKHDESDDDVVPVAKKAPTEPWSAENAPDSPRKHGLLGVAKGKEGHELRWVRADAIDRRKNQGYVLATPKDFDATPDENGMIRRNELVLMVVPKEVYDARREDIAKATKAQASGPRKEFLRERDAASRASGHNLSDEKDEE